MDTRTGSPTAVACSCPQLQLAWCALMGRIFPDLTDDGNLSIRVLRLEDG
jgi:hypothetical protein